MRRRQFLITSGRAAAGVAILPFGACARAARTVSERHDVDSWRPVLADLETQIPQLMAEAKVPGLSIAIVADGGLLWQRAFGVKDVRSKAPVDHDTLFEAASTSKPVFAYAVMKLCETGVMNLDTPLTRYTTDRLLDGDPRLDAITARHVLSHTTGLPNWRSTDDPLAIRFTPGERWSYSGEAYSYLQSVFTRMTGGHVDRSDCGRFELDVDVCATDIDTYMRRHLLSPFGMTASGYLWTGEMQRHVAWGHDPTGNPLASDRRPSGPSVGRYGMAGGLYTTPTDYAKFLLEILKPRPSDSFRLTSDSRREMLRPQIRRNAESSWALGWEINHTPTGDFIRHGGGNPGFSCFVAGSVQRKAGYVIMTNGEDSGYLGVIAPLISGDTLSRFIGGKLRAASE
jgi:CubicO group peptidase (beta-lactamase class C family)